MQQLLKKIRRTLNDKKNRRQASRVVSSLCCVIVFVTTYAMVLPAITMEQQAQCGIEAHQHYDSCYELQPVCGLEESADHAHTDACYEKVLICGKEAHVHSKACYTDAGKEMLEEVFTTAQDMEQVSAEEAMGAAGGSSETQTADTPAVASGDAQSAGADSAVSGAQGTDPAFSDAQGTDPAFSDVQGTDAAAEGAQGAGGTSGDAQGASNSGTASPSPEETAEGTNSDPAGNSAAGDFDEFAPVQPGQADSATDINGDTGEYTSEDKSGEAGATDAADTAEISAPAQDAGAGTGAAAEDTNMTEAQEAAAMSEDMPALIFEDTILIQTATATAKQADAETATDAQTGAENQADAQSQAGTESQTDAGISPARDLLPAETNITVHVEAEEGTFPAGTSMVLATVQEEALDKVAEAVSNSVEGTSHSFQAVDISFRDASGNEIEPAKPVRVTMTSDAIKTASETPEIAEPVVLHMVDEGKAEKIEQTDLMPASDAANSTAADESAAFENAQTANENLNASPDTVSFDSDQFSTYVIVYTVDFHYEVNGKMYEFSIPGGGFVSLEHLVEVLGIARIGENSSSEGENQTNEGENAPENGENTADSDVYNGVEETGVDDNGANGSIYDESINLNNVEVSEATKNFVADVASVEFSSPELVWVGKVEETATVGGLKEANGLNVEYSTSLTKEQIEAINRTEIKSGDWALISMQPFTSEEKLTVTMKNGEVFTVKVTDAQISTLFLSASGKLYEVTVTYDEAANIPEGSTLQVTEFSEDDAEYEYARNSVLADKKARGELVDLNSFGLAALDISILDPDGVEIEPEAPMQVDIRIKELPGVENLSEVADTLAIQHHVEVEDGVVVETVFDGNTEASFMLETDEAVAAEGIAVDPNSVSEEDYSIVEVPSSYSYGGIEDGEIDVSFQTHVFSTFTVTWNGSSSTSNSVSYIWATAAGVFTHQFKNDGSYDGQYTLQTNNLHFMNSSQLGIPGYIFRTPATETATGDLYLVYNHTGNGSGDQNVGEADSTFHIRFNYNGSTYADITVHYVDGEGNPIRRTKTSDVSYTGGSIDTRNVDGTDSNRTLSNYAGSKDGYTFAGVSEVKPSNQPPHATIHYVDTAGNELTVSNGQPVTDTASMTYYYYGGGTTDYPYNYLIYDVDGYEYAYTYRNQNTNANHITPILTYRDNRWKYTSGTNTTGANNTWTNLSENDDIYVVYEPKKSVSEGGKPVPKITGEKPDVPTITKNSVVNGDGTNTLSLSVTGHTSIMEAEKLADVIVVFDVSGSMNEDMAGHEAGTAGYSGDSRFVNAKNATIALANSLLGKNTTEHPDLIRMSLISFSNTAQKKQDFTTDKTQFNNTVTNLSAPDGGTNWEYALQLANEMAVESDRATFVVFVTDGNPTFRQTRGVLNNGGTNALGDNDVTDYYFAYNVYGKGDSDNHGRNYAAALTQAQSIVNHNKNFYTIGISNDVTNLTKLTTEAGAGADHSKTATSNDELVAAFNDIATSIIAYMGYSDVKITDGITDLTQTVRKSTLVNFAEDDFTYYKGKVAVATQADVDAGRASKVGDPLPATQADVDAGLAEKVGGTKVEAWQSWTPASEGCAEAVYNTTTGAVEWNMGETFMLEDGYTYQVRFKVWPSQEAYDLLADLNNGKKSYDSLSEEEKAQIKEPTTSGGMYTLKTNSETSYTYREATKSGDTVTPVGDPSEPGSFPDVDPLELTTKPLKVKKQWHNNYSASRDPIDSITMELYGVDSDGTTSHNFKTITLTGENDWYAENNYISYGLVTYNTTTNSGEKIYETGHDFTLREIDDEAHYYELTAGVFRPMFINGTPTILERVDETPAGMSGGIFHYSDGSYNYYRLDGKVYRDTESDILLIATNSRRSYMDLIKEVVDESGAAVVDDTEFEYKITFTVPSGIANYDSVEKYIWFSVYDSVAGRTLSPSEYICSGVITPAQENPVYDVPAYANYLVATSGQQLTLKIKQGWNVRFLNLPIGTTYSFEETNIPEGYNFVKAEVSGTRWIANMVNGSDQGSVQTMTSLPSNTSGDNSNTGISGTIEFANARYSTTYTNKAPTQQVVILKTSQDGTTPLQGAVFSLYTESGYNADPKQASKTDLTSGTDGKIDLGRLTAGKYYLVETSAPAGYILLAEPVEITVTGSGVTYNQSNSSLSQSGNGISHEKETDPYTLTVINNAGYELPSTGGPGTTLLYLLGIMLTGLAGAGLVMKRLRRNVA